MTVARATDTATTRACWMPSSSMSSLRLTRNSTNPTSASSPVRYLYSGFTQRPSLVADAHCDVPEVLVHERVGLTRGGAPQRDGEPRVLLLQRVDGVVAQHHDLDRTVRLRRGLLPVVAAEGQLTEGHPRSERAQGHGSPLDPAREGVDAPGDDEEHAAEALADALDDVAVPVGAHLHPGDERGGVVRVEEGEGGGVEGGDHARAARAAGVAP